MPIQSTAASKRKSIRFIFMINQSSYLNGYQRFHNMRNLGVFCQNRGAGLPHIRSVTFQDPTVRRFLKADHIDADMTGMYIVLIMMDMIHNDHLITVGHRRKAVMSRTENRFTVTDQNGILLVFFIKTTPFRIILFL